MELKRKYKDVIDIIENKIFIVEMQVILIIEKVDQEIKEIKMNH